MTPAAAFEWTIDESRTWPPASRPGAPYGVTQLEIIRSCALRACFDISSQQGYPRRTGPDARIGLAFHRALQSLRAAPVERATPEAQAENARARFQQELSRQNALREAFPREQRLSFNEERVHRATEAVMLAADRLPPAPSPAPTAHLRPSQHSPVSSGPGAPGTVEVEVPIQSTDGEFIGRVDLAEHRESGTRLIDFKSAFRDDLPPSYERQIQLYAWMWYQTRGVWPVEGQIIYPFTGRVHAISVEPQRCQEVAAEARQVVGQLAEGVPPSQLANPGETCKVCEFRPWCRPFWQWQAKTGSRRAALEQAALGFEGTVRTIGQQDQYWVLQVAWQGTDVQLATPAERFPHLKAVSPGMRLRILDTRLHGQMYQPRALVTEYSEIWRVVSTGDPGLHPSRGQANKSSGEATSDLKSTSNL
jgi:hypothetical protein